MVGIPVGQLLEDQGRLLELSLLVGHKGLGRIIPTPEMNRPGLAFAGFYDVFSHDRVQIVGLTEVSYLNSQSPEELRSRLKRTFEFTIPCIIVTTDQKAPPLLAELADEHDIPLLATPLPTSRFWAKLSFYLEHEFAPTEIVHASMLDVFGLGVLLMGRSGVGKSECALELIERGHRLIADDSVVLKRMGRHVITGTAAAAVSHHMEVRGIGIIDVEKLFGVGSVCEEKPVHLVAILERWEEGKTYERAGLEEKTFRVLDVELPEYVIPVEPGRNLSLLVEVAALTQRLRSQGHNPAEELNQRLIERMRTRTASGTPLSPHTPFPGYAYEGLAMPMRNPRTS